jgi:predicted RNA-binding protein with PIN domain
MLYLVDGSNILGLFGASRESAEAKRALVEKLAQFAKGEKARVICYFDGDDRDSIRSRGAVRVEFSGRGSADDRLAAEREKRASETLRVVTSDNALAARVRSRRTEVIASAAFKAQLESLEQEGTADDVDWQAYFSNPKNRNC